MLEGALLPSCTSVRIQRMEYITPEILMILFSLKFVHKQWEAKRGNIWTVGIFSSYFPIRKDILYIFLKSLMSLRKPAAFASIYKKKTKQPPPSPLSWLCALFWWTSSVCFSLLLHLVADQYPNVVISPNSLWHKKIQYNILLWAWCWTKEKACDWTALSNGFWKPACSWVLMQPNVMPISKSFSSERLKRSLKSDDEFNQSAHFGTSVSRNCALCGLELHE